MCSLAFLSASLFGNYGNMVEEVRRGVRGMGTFGRPPDIARTHFRQTRAQVQARETDEREMEWE